MLHSTGCSKQRVPEIELRDWANCLLNPEVDVVSRSRALWGLRHATEPLATDLICGFLSDFVPPSPAANVLLQHEAAYCLGQRGSPLAIDCLAKVVRDARHHPVVRHEAAEGLAAMHDVPNVDSGLIENLLSEFTDSDVVELAETCQVGLGRLNWLRKHKSNDVNEIAKQHFPETVDPAPGFGKKELAVICSEENPCSDNGIVNPVQLTDKSPGNELVTTGSKLSTIMMDSSRPLFDRYRALFSLRDFILEAKSDPALFGKPLDALSLQLASGLRAPGSALLRHEVAFVLGQLAIPVTASALSECVSLLPEHPMVRHEAAEALGAVLSEIDSTLECEEGLSNRTHSVLEKFVADKEALVRESCIVALDMAGYGASKCEFQYANVPSSMNDGTK